jgi:hypothetical protein
MLMTVMNNSPRAESAPEAESVRLQLGELIQLSDELAHRSSRLRDDGREIIGEVLVKLRSLCTSGDTRSDPESDRCGLVEARRDLRSRWLCVDARIDDLLSSAADEIAQFVAIAESRIGACERAVRHRERRNALHGEIQKVATPADPLPDRVSGPRKGNW